MPAYVQPPAKWVEIKSSSIDNADQIILFVAHYFEKTVEILKKHDRSQACVYPRHMAFYLLRTLTSLSTIEIGRRFGHVHHTTVIHGFNKINGYKSIYPRTAADVEFLTDKIKNNEHKI